MLGNTWVFYSTCYNLSVTLPQALKHKTRLINEQANQKFMVKKTVWKNASHKAWITISYKRYNIPGK